jgi:enoyl-CoA hydratase/carnithine racemase
LGPAIGGAARPLALSGDLLDGPAALALGLAARCAPPEALSATVAELLRALSTKGPHALAATKRWLNELDGTVRDDAFLRTSEASAALVAGEETREMLHTFWESRRRSRGAAAGS